jgi:lactate dehydrogenase-like 2-hydroxyacid dehydrogenase
MAILLAAIRRLPFLNSGVRNGLWRDDIPRPPHVSGRRMGIFGLGNIGKAIARRAQGFDMEIGYHSRTRRDETGFRLSGCCRTGRKGHVSRGQQGCA